LDIIYQREKVVLTTAGALALLPADIRRAFCAVLDVFEVFE
jgi:hypothetical protein